MGFTNLVGQTPGTMNYWIYGGDISNHDTIGIEYDYDTGIGMGVTIDSVTSFIDHAVAPDLETDGPFYNVQVTVSVSPLFPDVTDQQCIFKFRYQAIGD
jgi:hypothetical protein